MSDSRRDFLKKSALLGLSGIAGTLIGNQKVDALENLSEHILQQTTPFSLPALPYNFDALEPFIDKQTMEIHHGKHHKAYVDKLNGADLSKINLTVSDGEKCKSINSDTAAVIRNNLGGHYNHSLFWQLLKSNPSAQPNLPNKQVNEHILKSFKTFEDFKKEFSDKALKIFGSGWCWLVLDDNNNLLITTTPNQDNPLMQVAPQKGKPILALDVWEHAYYLKYQNKRVDYINNWWNIINWQKAEELLTQK